MGSTAAETRRGRRKSHRVPPDTIDMYKRQVRTSEKLAFVLITHFDIISSGGSRTRRIKLKNHLQTLFAEDQGSEVVGEDANSGEKIRGVGCYSKATDLIQHLNQYNAKNLLPK